jgi:Family of unknown function (DUF5678)
MATAAVSIAPVLTPHTLSVLADALEHVHLPEKASSLRKLQPFIQVVVERYFVPLSSQPRKGTFVSRFNRLSKEFEPFRLYLNFKLLGTLENQEFLGFYEQILRDVLEPLIKTAREMHMGPELISATVRDYMKIVRALSQPTDQTTLQASELTVDQFSYLVDWFHAATRFDYALTAIFLVLEGSIPRPSSTEKGALLSSCKKALTEFSRTTSKVVDHEDVQRALQDLETPHIEINAAGNGLRVLAAPRLEHSKEKGTLGFSRRQSEVNWLAQNKDLAERYGGQWIVLEKDELVASDADYRKARDVATQRGIKRPFIIFVPSKENSGFMGI